MSFSKQFWNPIAIKDVVGLAQLRTLIVQRSEKRMPKWKFGIAPDLVIQIQPKVSERFRGLFECRAFAFPGVDEKVFESRKGIRGLVDYALYFFRIYAVPELGGDDWWIEGRTTAAYRTVPPDQWHTKPRRIFCPEVAVALRDRVVEAFNGNFFDHIKPANMLSAHCMLCGKGLTDPASMARMIGPECWGSGSLNLPWLVSMKEQVLQTK